MTETYCYLNQMHTYLGVLSKIGPFPTDFRYQCSYKIEIPAYMLPSLTKPVLSPYCVF